MVHGRDQGLLGNFVCRFGIIQDGQCQPVDFILVILVFDGSKKLSREDAMLMEKLKKKVEVIYEPWLDAEGKLLIDSFCPASWKKLV
jgi:hypothetical protein